MQGGAEQPQPQPQPQPAHKKMEELRLICDREVPIQQGRMDSAVVSFRKSLESAKLKAQETVQTQANVGELKAHLRELEAELVKALSVKTRKEAKKMAMMDSLAASRARIEELKSILEDQRAKKNEYAAIISQQVDALAACEENCGKDKECRGEIEEAISWYNKVLSFRIDFGHGIKFVFTAINLKNPEQEYSFTIRHENNVYTLLDCNPHLKDMEKLINELNKNNGLFKFVRTMREKFQELAEFGHNPQATSFDRVSATVSISAPISSFSTDDRSESPANRKELEGEMNRHSRQVNHSRVAKLAKSSPRSAGSVRKSPRFKK